MPGKNAPGYRAAYASADREAAQIWRHENPDKWRELLDKHLTQRGLKDKCCCRSPMTLARSGLSPTTGPA